MKEQLIQLAEYFSPDHILTGTDVDQILMGIINILGEYKKGTETINKETKESVEKLLFDVTSIHKESIRKIDEDNQGLKNKTEELFNSKIEEANNLIKEIKSIRLKDGEPGKDADEGKIVSEVLAQIKLPEFKETIVTGEEIIDKLNALPLEEDNKIDYARLKNVPIIKGKSVMGSPTVLANAVDLDGSTRADTYAITWDATRGRYTHTIGSGSGDVTKVGTPVDNQIGVWTGNGTIEGDSSLTFDTTTNFLTANGNLSLGTGNFLGFTGGTTVDTTNYSLFGNATLTLLNARSGGSISFRIANVDVANFTTTGGYGFGATYYNIDPGQNNMTVEGKLGVGNSAPSKTLDVTGTGNFTSTLTANTTLELGHATDTTLSRSAAGVLAVEGVVIPSISSTNTLTNKRTTPRAYNTTSLTTLTPETDTYDYFELTAQAANLTVANASTTTPTRGEKMVIAITSDATPRTLTFGTNYVAKGGIALPTTTVASKTLTLGFMYNGGLAKWNLIASAQES